MTAPTQPAYVITGPAPFTPRLTDPVAFIISEFAKLLEKIEQAAEPALAAALVVFRTEFSLLWVIGPFAAPLDGTWVQRVSMVRTAYEAGDIAGLIAIYDRQPLHPNEMRVLARLGLVLLGVPSSAFPTTIAQGQ